MDVDQYSALVRQMARSRCLSAEFRAELADLLRAALAEAARCDRGESKYDHPR